MATTYGAQATKVLSTTKSTPQAGFVHASDRSFNEQVTFASQASGDIIVVGMIPKGAIFQNAVITTDTSTSTATLALSTVTLNAAGVASVASAGKYAAAAAYTTTDTPVTVGKTAAQGVTVTGSDDILALVVGTAALPASGNLKITINYTFN